MSSGTPCPFPQGAEAEGCYSSLHCPSPQEKSHFDSLQIHKLQKPAVGDGKIRVLALTPIKSFLTGPGGLLRDFSPWWVPQDDKGR